MRVVVATSTSTRLLGGLRMAKRNRRLPASGILSHHLVVQFFQYGEGLGLVNGDMEMEISNSRKSASHVPKCKTRKAYYWMSDGFSLLGPMFVFSYLFHLEVPFCIVSTLLVLLSPVIANGLFGPALEASVSSN